MTPMVDLAFLLVTFFMLTTKFAAEEPLIVDMPTSQSEIKLPETDILTISIAKDGRVFFNMDGKYTRQQLLTEIGQKYNLSFTPVQIQAFSIMSSIGMPVQSLPGFLNLSPDERKLVNQPGIPCDSLDNQLADWVIFSRIANPKLRIAIKGDRDADYPVARKVINTLIDNRVTRFNLITNLEQKAS